MISHDVLDFLKEVKGQSAFLAESVFHKLDKIGISGREKIETLEFEKEVFDFIMGYAWVFSFLEKETDFNNLEEDNKAIHFYFIGHRCFKMKIKSNDTCRESICR